MANRKAVATGNWNSLATWDGGVSLPAAGDDVYANGFTVTINQNVTCLSLRTTSGTGIVAGGGFSMPNVFDVTANLIPGTTTCLSLTATTGTTTITGNVAGSATTAAAYGISHTGGCNLIVIGNCTGGSITNSAQAVISSGSCGDVTITGNVTTASSNSTAVSFAPASINKTFTYSGTITTAGIGCLAITGAVAGGTVANITATVVATASGFAVWVAGTNPTVNLTCTGGFTATLGGCLTSSSVGGTITINGDIRHGSSAAYSVSNTMTGSGTITINGNVYGATGGSNAIAIISNNAPNTTTINGDIIGQSGTATGNCWVINNSSSGSVVVNGNVTGGTTSTVAAVNNSSTGSFTINGVCTGGTSTAGASHGLTNQSTGTVFVTTAKSNDYPNGGNTQQAFGTMQVGLSGWITVDSMEDGSGGWPACSGRHFVRAAGTNFCKMRESNAGAITTMGEVGADYPAPVNVRYGTAFNFGAQTGTLKVPPVGSVALGVPIDNTTGTAVLTGVTLAQIEASTVLAMKSDVTAVPSAVRSNLSTELSRIDVNVSSRLSTAGYTAPDNTKISNIETIVTALPSAATIASAVRTNLLAELSRIDVNVSSRLSTVGYTAPDNTKISNIETIVTALPSAATIASAVRTNLLAELSRIDVNVSSRLSTAGYTAPDNASILGIKSNTDLIPAAL